jgi:hypothetical protein
VITLWPPSVSTSTSVPLVPRAPGSSIKTFRIFPKVLKNWTFKFIYIGSYFYFQLLFSFSGPVNEKTRQEEENKERNNLFDSQFGCRSIYEFVFGFFGSSVVDPHSDS